MRKPYTPKQITYLKSNYANMPTKQIAASIGKTERSVYQKAAVLKLFKSDEYLQRSDSGRILKGERRGSATSFKKGQAPQNKGKKQSEFMSAEGIERTKATRFQKGLKPHNTKEDNAISIRGKKNKPEKYKYIRIGLGKWQLYHRYLWEQAFGEIPKGMIVAFKNGDAMDCQIENLKLISRKENAIRNSGSLNLTDGYVAKCLAGKNPELQQHILHNHPELVQTAKLNYQLNRKIKHHAKQ
jgi:hypothetical protein